MKTKALLIVAGLVILGLSLFDFYSYNMKSINEFLTDQVDRHGTPSIQYAFFDTDSIIYVMRHGLKNVKSQEKIDAKTTYNLFSVTKTFTALAVLQLVQEGKVELTQAASVYLSEFPYRKDITVEQLLSHTAGIPNPMPLKWIHLSGEHNDFDRNKYFSGIFKAHPEVEFVPGTDFKYSNLGYVLLGQLVESVSGQSLEEYMKKNIFQPSGAEISSLGFEINPDAHATGYHKWWSFTNAIFGFLFDKAKFMGPREGRWKPFNQFYTNGAAYGGMMGSAEGLIHYAQALLKENSILLSDGYKKILFTEKKIGSKGTGMSLSWYTGSLKGNRYLAHAGGGGGYYIELRLYPDLGMGSVIMYNRSGMTDQRILDKADAFFITHRTSE